MTTHNPSARYRRWDILDGLVYGDMKRISQRAHCSLGHVSKVINGYISPNGATAAHIIRCAEEQVSINNRIRNRYERTKRT